MVHFVQAVHSHTDTPNVEQISNRRRYEECFCSNSLTVQTPYILHLPTAPDPIDLMTRPLPLARLQSLHPTSNTTEYQRLGNRLAR